MRKPWGIDYEDLGAEIADEMEKENYRWREMSRLIEHAAWIQIIKSSGGINKAARRLGVSKVTLLSRITEWREAGLSAPAKRYQMPVTILEGKPNA